MNCERILNGLTKVHKGGREQRKCLKKKQKFPNFMTTMNPQIPKAQ